MAKVLTIASGKGGVGKTSISLNLSLALARAGYRVCLFDADLGLANVNILTGLYPDYGLADVIDGDKNLAEIMIRDFNGIDIIPGSSGVERLADMSNQEAGELIAGFLDLPDYDYFIIDTSAGISAQVLAFCRACHEMILVATPEPTSLTDAYSLIKVLSRQGRLPRIRVVINQVRTHDAAKRAYAKLKKTVHKFLGIAIAPLGILARDPNVPIAVVSQIPFLMIFPDSKASRCIRAIALKLVKDPGGDMPVEAFWDQCLALLAKARPEPEPEAVPAPEPESASQVRDAERILVQEGQKALEGRLDAIEETMGRLLKEMAEVKTLLLRKSAVPESKPAAPAPKPARPEPVRQDPENPLDLPVSPVTLDFEDWWSTEKP